MRDKSFALIMRYARNFNISQSFGSLKNFNYKSVFTKGVNCWQISTLILNEDWTRFYISEKCRSRK